MKFKPTEKAGGLVVEMSPREAQLPMAETAAAAPLFKLKKILVPVDFSECSQKALQYAIPFARQFEAELALLHVLQPFVPMPELPQVDFDSLEDAKKELEALRQTIPSPVDSRMVLRRGDPSYEIVSAAKELDIDLIILSTHGRTGMARVLLGSTAEKVVRHASCPVLVVREREHEFVAAQEGI